MLELRSVFPPTDGVVLSQGNVAAKNRSRNYGEGHLFIAEQCVCWVAGASPVTNGSSGVGENGHAESRGLQLAYPEIALHAISKDPSSFPEECIYMLLDGVSGADPGPHTDMENGDGHDEAMDENGSAHADDAEESSSAELCFVPQDKSTLEAIFAAMASCQALHPDPDDAGSESDEDGMNEDGLANAVVDDEQFDEEEADAEPEDGSGDAPS